MARVNHKLVRQRLDEKRSSITDKQFFTSRLLAGHYEDIVDAQTRRYQYNRRVRVRLFWEPDLGMVADTDDFLIRINTGNKLVTDVVGRENRYQIVSGLFAHELGHVLYTDFPMMQTYANYLANGKWYPQVPEADNSQEELNELDFWKYVKEDERNLLAVQNIALKTLNVIEDGYIENCVLNRFPGTLGYGLETLREVHFNRIDTVTQLKEEEAEGKIHIFESLLQVILSYVKFGEIKYGDESFADYRIQTVFELIPVLDKALFARNSRERYNAVNKIIIKCWPHMKSFCEYCKEKQDASGGAGGSGSLEEAIDEALKGLIGSSTIGKGTTMSVGDNVGEETEDESTASKRASTKKNAEGEDEENEDSNSANGTGGSNDESEDESEGENSAEGSGLPMAGGSGGKKQDVTSEEGGRIPYHDTDNVYNPDDGETEYNDEYEREKYDKAASDIERVLEAMAEKATCEALEDERLAELNDFAQNVSYGNVHSGVRVRVNRISEVDEDLIEQYQRISAPLITISKQLQRSIEKQLKESQRGSKQTNLLFGRRLDSHGLHRNDGKVFYKNNLPSKIELAVGLLVDESGSMYCGDRATYARAAALILYDFCDSLGVPVTVYGHSTSYPTGKSVVELYSYAEFDSIDNLDRYRIMDIQARDSNRDGAALRFVAEKLLKRPEQAKLLILVSDGQPADYGYSGSAAEEDLRGIKQEYTRKGITFVAAAIGDDKPSIERIYGDSFLDITDLNQLPTKLTAVVKRHIRV